MAEQFNKLTTSKKWKGFGLLAVLSLLVIGGLIQCGNSVCEGVDSKACSQLRKDCLDQSKADEEVCIQACETSAKSNLGMLRCAKRCENESYPKRQECRKTYAWQYEWELED